MKGSHQSESHWQSIMARPDPTQVEVDKIIESNDALRIQNTQLLNDQNVLMAQNTTLMLAVTEAVGLLMQGDKQKALKMLVDLGLDATTDVNLSYLTPGSSAILRKNPRND